MLPRTMPLASVSVTDQSLFERRKRSGHSAGFFCLGCGKHALLSSPVCSRMVTKYVRLRLPSVRYSKKHQEIE